MVLKKKKWKGCEGGRCKEEGVSCFIKDIDYYEISKWKQIRKSFIDMEVFREKISCFLQKYFLLKYFLSILYFDIVFM